MRQAGFLLFAALAFVWFAYGTFWFVEVVSAIFRPGAQPVFNWLANEFLCFFGAMVFMYVAKRIQRND